MSEQKTKQGRIQNWSGGEGEAGERRASLMEQYQLGFVWRIDKEGEKNPHSSFLPSFLPNGFHLLFTQELLKRSRRALLRLDLYRCFPEEAGCQLQQTRLVTPTGSVEGLLWDTKELVCVGATRFNGNQCSKHSDPSWLPSDK